MCGVCYEAEPYNIKENGQLSNSWFNKYDHCEQAEPHEEHTSITSQRLLLREVPPRHPRRLHHDVACRCVV